MADDPESTAAPPPDRPGPAAPAGLAPARPLSAPALPDSQGAMAWVVWTVAAAGVVAGLLGRSLEPALPGIWLNIDAVIAGLKLVAGFLSQLFAVCTVALIIRQAVAISRSPQPTMLRIMAVGVGGLVIMAVMSASAVRLPVPSSIVAAVATALLALLVAVRSARTLTLRGPALILAGVSLGALCRAAALSLSYLGGSRETPLLNLLARISATGSVLAEALLILLALAWLVRGTGRRKHWELVGLLILLIASVVLLVTRGAEPEAHKASVLLRRMLDSLLLGPEPYIPWLGRCIVEAAAWILALTYLLRRRPDRTLAAIVALSLSARSLLETPLCAGSVVLAATLLCLHPGAAASRSMLENGAAED